MIIFEITCNKTVNSTANGLDLAVILWYNFLIKYGKDDKLCEQVTYQLAQKIFSL